MMRRRSEPETAPIQMRRVKYPYGTMVQIRNSKIYKNKKFVFLTLCMNGEKALLYRPNEKIKAQYYLLANPKHVIPINGKNYYDERNKAPIETEDA